MSTGTQPQPAKPHSTARSASGGAGVSLSRNAAANLAGLSVYLLVAFFLSPFILRSLGDVRYGVWSLAAELVGYYSLLDLGLRNAVSYFIAHYTARQEPGRLESSICSAFWVLLTLGLTAGMAGAGLALLFPRIFVRGQTDPHEVVIAIMITSVMVGAGLAMELFSAVLTGCRRLDLVNATEIGTRVLLAAGIYAVLSAGGGLIGISLVQTGARILTWSINYRQAQRVTGGFSLHPSHFRKSELRALGNLGSLNIAMTLSQTVMARSDLFIVGAFVGLRAVAFYNLARLLLDYAGQVNTNLTAAFRPHLTHLYSKSDMEGVRRLYLLGTRISGLISLPLGACILTFGHYFLALWVGAKYVSGPVWHRSDVIMTVLLAGAMLRWQQSMSYQALLATGKYGRFAAMTGVQAGATVAASLILVRFYGPVGVALGTLIPAVLMNGIAVPRHALARCGITLVGYLRDGVARAAASAVLVFVFAQWLVRTWQPATWRIFFAEAAAAVAAAAAIAYIIGLKTEDRRLANERIAGFAARLAIRR